MNNFCCEPRMALRCCDTALELCSYRYPPAMLAAMASLCNGAVVNWWVCPSRCGLKLKLIGFPAIQIPEYLVITPNMRTVSLAWSDRILLLVGSDRILWGSNSCCFKSKSAIMSDERPILRTLFYGAQNRRSEPSRFSFLASISLRIGVVLYVRLLFLII